MTQRAPAPGDLELVRRFANTLDVEEGTDALADDGRALAWLRAAGLVGDGVTGTPDDAARLRGVREALRAALEANHRGAPVPDAAADVLDRAARRADLGLTLVPSSGWVARPRATGVDGAVGTVLAAMAGAMTDGTWQRLKVCVNDACQWAFYDSSRGRTGRWCSMEVCGNRVKQQAWRARQAPAPS